MMNMQNEKFANLIISAMQILCKLIFFIVYFLTGGVAKINLKKVIFKELQLQSLNLPFLWGF